MISLKRIKEEFIMFELKPYRKNNAVREYNPFREMDEFFADPFGGFFSNRELAAFKTDISDEGDHYLLEADLPGFDKKDIHLDINGDTLTISAERNVENKTEEKKNKYVRMERSYGRYVREFDISTIDAANIKAKYDGGVLSLTLPKKSEVLPQAKRLEIE